MGACCRCFQGRSWWLAYHGIKVDADQEAEKYRNVGDHGPSPSLEPRSSSSMGIPDALESIESMDQGKN